MKNTQKAFLVFTFIFFFLAQESKAQEWGAGLVLGEPTGLVLRHELREPTELHGTFAWSFGDYFISAVDYAYYFRNVEGFTGQARKNLSFYVGGGAVILISTANHSNRKLDSSGDAGVGARIPLGVEWKFGKHPFAAFFELAPGIGLIPKTFGFITAGLGGVYKF